MTLPKITDADVITPLAGSEIYPTNLPRPLKDSMNAHSLIIRRIAIPAALLGITPALAQAQTVIGNLPPATTMASSRQLAAGAPATVSQSSIFSAFSHNAPFFQRGDFVVRPHLTYRLLYGDGLLQPTQNEAQDSIIQTLAVGSIVEIGKHLTFDYTMTQNVYSNKFLRDSTDHSLQANAGTSYGDWTFEISQDYSLTSPTLVETGQQAEDQELYSTTVSVSRVIGDRTRLEVSGVRSVRKTGTTNPTDVEWTVADWTSWTNVNSLIYKVTPKLEAGAVVTFGYDEISASPNMKYTRVQARLTWRPRDVLTISAQAGRERRTFDGARSPKDSPIYSASAAYELTKVTTLTIDGSRSVTASYFANQATESDSIGVGVQQRFLGRYFVNATAVRGNTKYFAVGSTFSSGRRDKSTQGSVRVSTPVFRRGSVGLFYQHGRTTSTVVDFTYETDQIGAEFSYNF